MNVWLKFSGWFQCRLATDPDPCDEPRGVSGYIRAVAGEPDLDRIIRLQPPVVQRSHCPVVGVKVTSVFGDSRYSAMQHPLIGAAVELLDNPKFEGRNHVVSEDGVEPIVPFHFRISKGDFVLRRKYSDIMKYPPETGTDRRLLRGLFATGINISPGALGEATGIWDLATVWSERAAKIQTDLNAATGEIEKAALLARLQGVSNPRNTRFFPARMLYSIALQGTGESNDPNRELPGTPVFEKLDDQGELKPVSWSTECWFGAWDADALSGFMEGYLSVPLQAHPEDRTIEFAQDLAAVISEPRQRRR